MMTEVTSGLRQVVMHINSSKELNTMDDSQGPAGASRSGDP